MKILRVDVNKTPAFTFTKRKKPAKYQIDNIEEEKFYYDQKPNSQDIQAFFAPFIVNAQTTPVNNVIKTPDVSNSFENSHAKFALDKYQKESIDHFNQGETVVTTAPTGTGKTLIAEYDIKKCLDEGKKVIYLSPLKALSNEKYTDFAKLFGTYDEEGNLVNTDNVGLLTGDTSINPDAPLLVMTTEIYRNSLLTKTEEETNREYKDTKAVIYDEFHYLGDPKRGTVWEEAVINTPKHMQQVMLSATASNAEKICGWLGKINGSIKTHLVNVPESERHVPLREMAFLKKGKGSYIFVPSKLFSIDTYKLDKEINITDRQKEALNEIKDCLNLETERDAIDYIKNIGGKRNLIRSVDLAQRLESMGMDPEKAESCSIVLSNKTSTKYKEAYPYDFVEDNGIKKLVDNLDKNKMTPALIYIFSKRKCNEELEQIATNGKSLLTEEEAQEVFNEVKAAEEKGVYLGSDFDNTELIALMKGYAVHHAGKLPAYKSLVEKLARKGLVKACFATETLIAGINMPFKTAVFTSLEKTNGEEIELISPQIFKQGGGRAGRRGKDYIGTIVTIPLEQQDCYDYKFLSSSNDTSINSSYNISYASLLSNRMLNNESEYLEKTLRREQNPDNESLEEDAKNKKELLLDLGYIEKNDEGKYVRTQKGEMAKKVFGINEIFFTELLTNPEYLKDFTYRELIALATSYADVKDEVPSRYLQGSNSYLNERLNKIFDLSDTIDKYENKYLGKEDLTKLSTTLVPYVTEFAESPQTREDSIAAWHELMQDMQDREIILHEGDFLRVVNSAADILKLIGELSPDKNIQKEAKIAISKLKKAPVTDIASYELNINEKE